MSEQNLTLAQRLELLFETITHEDGRRYTYDDVRRLGNVDPSTISRIRSGRILDPAFSNIAGIAEAFGVTLDYFTLQATEAELRQYLAERQNKQHLEQLRDKQRRQVDQKVEALAHRASHLDREGIEAVVGMIDYVLRQQGVKMESREEPEQ